GCASPLARALARDTSANACRPLLLFPASCALAQQTLLRRRGRTTFRPPVIEHQLGETRRSIRGDSGVGPRLHGRARPARHPSLLAGFCPPASAAPDWRPAMTRGPAA